MSLRILYLSNLSISELIFFSLFLVKKRLNFRVLSLANNFNSKLIQGGFRRRKNREDYLAKIDRMLRLETKYLINHRVLKIGRDYSGFGAVHPSGKSPISLMISLWVVQVPRIASGVPIPPALGSPHGPKKWLAGAPVVLDLLPK
jgi:hypothetical protein